ncbi:hypothetical protein EDB81DRAFT_925604 [Dactylonectria macrodidyma]|uniref:C3H1-type domain-containing protein n=1 Tax=Dactylonectria macrodidyma TaxID=307937 RepID=A0A9P9JDV0_9HYPO|nr:hypothetical protein EDB81DRAFT_925604 [Dactylonectria macrodidyma]
MSAHVVVDFATRLAAAQAAENEKNEWLKGFATTLSNLVTQFADASRDLESEKLSRRALQQEADDLRVKYEQLQSSVFKDEYYTSDKGGRKAAVDLRDRVREHMQNEHPELAHLPVTVKGFANEHGLSQLLSRAGILPESRSIIEFAKDFSQAYEMADFVLVGSGKDRVDKKVQGVFKQFVKNPTCRHIVMGACHDNGYVRLLEDYVDDKGVIDRVTLLRSFQVGREVDELGLKSMTMNSVFRDRPVKAQDVPIPPVEQPATRTVSNTHSSVMTWAAAASKNSENDTQSAATTVYVNKEGQRIDKRLPEPAKRDLEDWIHKTKKVNMRYCRSYHLNGSCSGRCTYSHGPLTDGEKLAYRRQLRLDACHTGLQCHDPFCFYGHNCSCVKPNCKFSREMHKLDRCTVKPWKG